MLILDTNAISEFMTPVIDAQFAKWLESFAEVEQFTCSICIFEIEKGIAALPNGKRRQSLRSAFDVFIENLVIIDFDKKCAEFAAQHFASRLSQGFNPKAEDMMIAGVCSANGAKLVTRNVKDFEGLPIEVVNPWAK